MLEGFREYIEAGMTPSVFDELACCKEPAVFYCCDGSILTGSVVANQTYEVTFSLTGTAEEAPAQRVVSKNEILLVCRAADAAALSAQLNRGKTGAVQPVEPLRKAVERHHIKNKTLYPLMRERQVVFITALNGLVLRGLVSGFNRYEINLSLKGGVPVGVLRHGVLKAQNKDGRSLLKADQETLQDWKKSPFYKKLV